ncbi:cell wall adhesin EAP1-like isoform X2 [Astatotilapia calliptera]|uniref:cell wall adhesin EAP1-like isoform X2 n=1 Tax=Astatotilapia calliptera TaxID=8154 RepID=UPI000E423A41|nr:cell wall adhesin EAP1-like isoform X2 [Astatotilapia calliptera]
MTSHGCFLCLLLLSVIPIEPSEAGCMDHFTKKGLANASSELPENITVKIMNKSEDIIVCSLTEAKDCANSKTENTCFLRDCFKDENNMGYKPPCNEADENISVPFYHFMCLTNIAKGLRDKTKPPEVCEVYKKVCGEDSATPAPPKPSPTTPTIEATPSTAPAIEATPSTAPAIEATPSTAPTIEATPSTPLPTTPTTKATPPTGPAIDATSSTAPTTKATPPTGPAIDATSSTAPAIEATPTIEVTTKNPSTASTTKTTAPSTTSSTTSTTAASFLVNSRSEKETGSDIQKILIGVLIMTNIIVPMAIYLYMRNQIQQIPNLREEVRMTEMQQNTFPRDVEEGPILLTTPESSIIINSPENTII